MSQEVENQVGEKLTNYAISVVIPVYNCEAYLERCLTSILEQSYRNFEVICVDDGSEDQSGSLLQKFAQQDERIRFFAQSNAGVSAARNRGIELAGGDFICFVDADDFVAPDYLEQFMRSHITPKTLLVQDIIRGEQRKMNYEQGVFSLSKDIDVLIAKYKILRNGGPIAKLFERKIIETHTIRFDTEVTYGEDLIFYLDYLRHVDFISFSDYAGYHYCYNGESASRKKHDFYGLFNVHRKIFDFIKTHSFKTRLALQVAYDVDWDHIERSIDDGIIAKNCEDIIQRKNLQQLANSLRFPHLKYAGKWIRRVQFILLKLGCFKVLVMLKKKITRALK